MLWSRGIENMKVSLEPSSALLTPVCARVIVPVFWLSIPDCHWFAAADYFNLYIATTLVCCEFNFYFNQPSKVSFPDRLLALVAIQSQPVLHHEPLVAAFALGYLLPAFVVLFLNNRLCCVSHLNHSRRFPPFLSFSQFF